jgi:ribosomal-protein-alanine N-acetyltransferase
MILPRAWTKEDIEKIADLERRCFSDPWSAEMFESAARSPLFHGLIARERGEVIGYACQTVLFEDAEILNVAVAPSVRGRGIGKALMSGMIEAAKTRGAETMFLEVRVSNVAALRLYRGFGFQDGYIRKKYYEDGEDALTMSLALQ